MKLSTYVKEYLSGPHPLLRLTKPFIEPSKKEFENICKQLDIMELGLDEINPLERLGLDLILSSVYVDTDKKEELKKLMDYLKSH